MDIFIAIAFRSVQSLSRVQLFATPWTAARQASLSITNSWSPPKPTSIESVMPSNHLILCGPLLLPSIFPSIRVFSNKSALHIRWRKYWSFSFSISPSNEHPGLLSFRMDSLQSKGLSGVFSNTTVQNHQFFSTQLVSQVLWLVCHSIILLLLASFPSLSHLVLPHQWFLGPPTTQISCTQILSQSLLLREPKLGNACPLIPTCLPGWDFQPLVWRRSSAQKILLALRNYFCFNYQLPDWS